MRPSFNETKKNIEYVEMKDEFDLQDGDDEDEDDNDIKLNIALKCIKMIIMKMATLLIMKILRAKYAFLRLLNCLLDLFCC